MDWKVFAVCIFAIAASYLIASIPLAHATEVAININGVSYQTVTYSPTSYIAESVIGNTTGARVVVANGVANTIDSVYIYKCKSLNPSSCAAQVAPVSYTGNTDAFYSWDDVTDSGNSNIMVVVHTNDASGGRWLNFWSYRVTGTNEMVDNMNIGNTAGQKIIINAKDSGSAQMIKTFINSNGMLPMNALWVTSIVLYGLASFFEIDSSSPPASTRQVQYTGNTLTNTSNSYAFVFPSDGSLTYNGVVVANSSASYVIGDGVCSSGESSDTHGGGCIDCLNVPAGYYCDTAKGIEQLSSITLSTITQNNIKVTNCNIPNTIQLAFSISNMPTETTLSSASYKLNGSATPATTSCTQSGNIFTCSITTPAVTGCTGASYVLNPNTMTLNIRFKNASSYITRGVSAGFPQITVGSWTCGQSGCESSLGESSANCCYDCGCPTSQYCDFTAGQPSTGACNSPLASTNLQVVSASPLNFYTHNTASGDNVAIAMQITNAPQSVIAGQASCRVSDCLMSGLPCSGSASCTIICARQASTNPDLYNSSCIMNFKIGSYDSIQNYSIYPVISQPVTYKNGTGADISGTLDVNSPAVSVGSHLMGDGVCSPDESPATVCYDCPCPSAQYCDSSSTSFFTANDSCRQLSGLNITLDSIGTTSLGDSAIQQQIPLVAHINSKPHGLSVSGACKFNNSAGAPACTMSCAANETAAGYQLNCIVNVPAINYKTTPFYNSETSAIILPADSASISLSFNNGSAQATSSQSFSLPNINIAVVPHCGDGICSSDINESSASCCIDCGCSTGTFCYPSAPTPNGECISSSEIRLLYDGIDPAATCTIEQLNGDCIFLTANTINAHVVNQPRNAQIEYVWFTERNATHDMYCLTDGTNYSCSTVIENLNASTQNQTTLNATMGFTMSYMDNGTQRVQNLTTAFVISVTREKSDYVQSCEAKLASLDKQKKDLENEKSIMITILIVIAVIVAIMWILCIRCDTCCDIAYWGTCILICAASVLLPMIMNIMSKLDAIKAQRQATCNTGDVSGLSKSNGDSSSLWSTLIGLVGGIACTVCLIIVGGTTSSAKPATPAPQTGSTSWFGGLGKDIVNLIVPTNEQLLSFDYWFGKGISAGTAVAKETIKP